MAERRMFAKSIIDSDAFLDMPATAQLLYFHLSMRADDEGFIGNPKRIMRMIGAADDDIRVLIGKRFIITFESGVVVIKHWKMHNYIQGDRFKPTPYQEERGRLRVKSNKAYTEIDDEPLKLLKNTQCIQNGYKLDTQVRLGKDSIDIINTYVEEPNKRGRFAPPTPQDVKAYCIEKGIEIDADRFCDFYESKGWMVGKNKMKDWKAAVRNWHRRQDKPKESNRWADAWESIKNE